MSTNQSDSDIERELEELLKHDDTYNINNTPPELRSQIDHIDKVSNILTRPMGERNPEHSKARRLLKKNNGELESNGRPCFTSCKQKSLCEGGLCNWNYYCLESNREGNAAKNDVKQICIPPESKKTVGGRKTLKIRVKKRGKTRRRIKHGKSKHKRRKIKRSKTKKHSKQKRGGIKEVQEYLVQNNERNIRRFENEIGTSPMFFEALRTMKSEFVDGYWMVMVNYKTKQVRLAAIDDELLHIFEESDESFQPGSGLIRIVDGQGGSKRKKRRNIKTTRKIKQYGKGRLNNHLGEGLGRLSNSTVIFKKDRIIIPISDNRSIEIKQDERLCKNWSANIRLPDGTLEYQYDGKALWIPLKNLDNEYLYSLINIFNKMNDDSYLSNQIVKILQDKFANSDLVTERKLLKSTC